MLGVKPLGVFSTGSQQFVVRTDESQVAPATEIQTKGWGWNVQSLLPADIAGQLYRTCKTGEVPVSTPYPGKCQSPALIVNEYGLGRTVYFAFDLFWGLDEATYARTADIFAKTLGHAHRPAASETYKPYQLAPMDLGVRNLALQGNIRVSADFPAEVSLYDRLSDKLTGPDSLGFDLSLAIGEPKNTPYYIVAPDYPGYFNLDVLADYTINGLDFRQSSTFEVAIEHDTLSLLDEVLTGLRALPVTGTDLSRVDFAVWCLEQFRANRSATPSEIQGNIEKLRMALSELLRVTGTDVTPMRTRLDDLLHIEQGRYFFGGK